MGENMENEKKLDQWIHKFRGAGLLSLCLLLFITGFYYFENGQEKSSLPASAQIEEKNRPICCVDTEQANVALTFDAAWGGG